MRAPTTFLVLSLFLGVLVCDQPDAMAAAPSDVRTQAPPTLSSMLAQVSPAVVNISVQGRIPPTENPLIQDPLFRWFFNLPDAPDGQRAERFSSGRFRVIFDAALGYVITNNHVVERAEKILVTLTDQRRLNATLVATDPQTDIALLKIEPDRLTSI